MKSLENIQLTYQGKPLLDAANEQQLTTLTCIQALLDNVEYASRADQRAADKLYDNLILRAEADIALAQFELEDSNYELIKKYILSYKPFLNGRMFGPVLNQFEE